MNKNKESIQLLWGAALILMGIALFFAIPGKMSQIEKIGQFSNALPFIKFSFYFIAVFLILGGGKKILQFKKKGDI